MELHEVDSRLYNECRLLVLSFTPSHLVELFLFFGGKLNTEWV